MAVEEAIAGGEQLGGWWLIVRGESNSCGGGNSWGRRRRTQQLGGWWLIVRGMAIAVEEAIAGGGERGGNSLGVGGSWLGGWQ
jgi:hypothetical protein